ncbi:MAG: ATP-binding protein [Chloroflexi bacterium]|nr:ATP-binding protein [Chloroflexota bacterium]
MRPSRGLRARAALGAAAGVLIATLVAGIALAVATEVEARADLAIPLILAAVLGAPLAAGLAAGLIGRDVRALRQVQRSTEGLLSAEGPEPFPRAGGPEVRDLSMAIADTTEALQAESRALEHDHARLETVLASMTDGVVIVETDNTVSLVNQAAADMLDVRARMEGQASLADALRDNDLVELIRAPTSAEQPAARLLSVGATEREVHAIAVPLGLPGLRQRLVLLRDLTDLRQTETVRRDFVANVSHELRTPLSALRALVETLQDGAADDPASRAEFLHGIEVEVERMSQMIAELLDLARIESGMADLELSAVDLNQIVAPAADRLRAQAARHELTLEVAAHADPLPVHADPDRTARVVMSLIHNAIKFTPPSGSIRVTTHQSDVDAVVSVSDTGAGLALDELDRVFERFYKSDPSRSGAGAGLGLSIARHTVRQHGGRIWAESPGLGHGATFSVALPLSQPARQFQTPLRQR